MHEAPIVDPLSFSARPAANSCSRLQSSESTEEIQSVCYRLIAPAHFSVFPISRQQRCFPFVDSISVLSFCGTSARRSTIEPAEAPLLTPHLHPTSASEASSSASTFPATSNVCLRPSIQPLVQSVKLHRASDFQPSIFEDSNSAHLHVGPPSAIARGLFFSPRSTPAAPHTSFI